MSDLTKKTIFVDRRFFITASTAFAGTMSLSPLVSAQRKGEQPTGQTDILEMGENRSIDVALLKPGELVVVSMAGTYYGILHRSPEQVAAAQATDAERQPVADADRVVEDAYLVVDMACTHRGCQVAYSHDVDQPFACPCHRTKYDASGRVLSGPARENLWVPQYQINGTVVTFTG